MAWGGPATPSIDSLKGENLGETMKEPPQAKGKKTVQREKQNSREMKKRGGSDIIRKEH